MRSLQVFESEPFGEDCINSGSKAGQGLLAVLEFVRSTTSQWRSLSIGLLSGTSTPSDLLSKLIEDRESSPSFTQSYLEFYETHFKGISKVF
jgi:hypothetical protein